MVRPPLRTIAERAGVSEPTVSRVLNGRHGVAAATRDRVIAVLAELGFTDVPQAPPSRGAVGIITGELTNPVFPALVHEIVGRLARHGIVSTIGVATTDLATEERYVSEFRSTNVDGLVFVAGRHAEHEGDLSDYQTLHDAEFPFVLVNGGETGLAVPHVRCDEAIAAERAVDHLATLGHQRIGCVLGPNRYLPTHRFTDGYARAMRRAGLAWSRSDIVEAPFTYEGGRAGGRRLLATGVTAIICANDLMAYGAVTAATSLGLSVPEGASIVGYDGTDASGTTDPPLTTLRQPFANMGELVADALVSEIERTARFRDTYVFTPELVARGSTGRLGNGAGPATRASDLVGGEA